MTLDNKRGALMTLDNKRGALMTLDNKRGVLMTLDNKRGVLMTLDNKRGVLMTLDDKRGVLLFLLDLTVAFDTVNHTQLLACMRSGCHRHHTHVGELKVWMTHHSLQLNDDKTEVLVITTPSSASKHSLTDVVIGDSILQPTAVTRNIDV